MNRYKFRILVACAFFLVGTGTALADIEHVEDADKIATEASVAAGYRGTSLHGEPGRAVEYDSLESSPTFKAHLFTDKGGYHLDFDMDYLGEDDYAAEVHVDTRGLIRLDLRSERFFHNLDHIPYDNGFSGGEIYPPPTNPPTAWPRTQTGTPAEGSRPDAIFPTTPTPYYQSPDLTGTAAGTKNPAYRAYYSDHDPNAEYGLRLDVNEAKLKIKCPDYPAHVTLSYWRFEKEGEKQLRFVGENCTTACHMQSKTRRIDRVTEEVKAGVDAHVGFVDIVLETLFRTFRDREPIPVDAFGSHSSRGPRADGDYEHSEDPDSKLRELTLRLNTAPSGGLVASTAFTLGKRENQSDLTSLAPVKGETDYYKGAADITYTPGENWTFNLRYRLLDLDSDNSSAINDLTGQAFPEVAATGVLPVRDSIDINRAWYEAIANYRPSKQLTLKAEFRREDIERSNTGDPTAHSYNNPGTAITSINTNWELPDEETITRVKLGFISRALERSALRINGWVALQQSDDPAYGTSFEKSRELFLAANYAPSALWGVFASVNLLSQENNDIERHEYALARDQNQKHLALGTWVTPVDGLSFDLNYGYFQTEITQDLLFGTSIQDFNPDPLIEYLVDYRILDADDEYRQTVQNITVGATWQALKNLSCRLEGYHIRSKASFSPNFAEGIYPYVQRGAGGSTFYFPGIASSTDLSDISRVDIRQNGVRGRLNWQIDEHLSCSFEATLDDYDERNSDVFDGSAQSYMASLTYTF